MNLFSKHKIVAPLHKIRVGAIIAFITITCWACGSESSINDEYLNNNSTGIDRDNTRTVEDTIGTYEELEVDTVVIDSQKVKIPEEKSIGF